MEFIEPNVELWTQGYTMKDIWKHIARCVRVCYQSTPKNENETEEAFVKRVLFKDDEHWNSVRNHLAMLEHGTIYLTVVHDAADEYEVCSFYKMNKYSKMICKEINGVMHHFITTNLRVIIENYREHDLQYLCTPTAYHVKRYTFCFTTNIGVSREFNRHRVNSIAEESTRYCNYSKKNDGQIKIGLPAWLLDGDLDRLNKFNNADWLGAITQIAESSYDGVGELKYNVDYYGAALYFCNICYNKLIERGWLPQQAREVLPLATKTQLVHTAFEADWQHFIFLRSDGVSGKPHPNAKILADKVKEILNL